jgi:uncharacterized protein DUF4350
VLLTAFGILFVATALLAGPKGRDDFGPEGTVALKRLLAGSRRNVRDATTPPDPPGTFVLLADLRDADQEAAIIDWVRRGGHLFLADPGSLLIEALGIEATGETSPGLIRPACAVPETRGVHLVDSPGGTGLVLHEPAAVACFPRDGSALVVAGDVEHGHVVVLGDPGVVTNEFLGNRDNAVFALQSIPEGDVVFGPAVPAGTVTAGQGVWKSLPTAARASIVELGLAAIAFALWRGRRLGRPVPEDPLVPIPSGELVRATGRLLRAARATPYAGSELRRAMIGRISRRAGTPAASAEELAMLLSRAGAGAEEELVRVLAGPEPRTDDELIALGREIEQLRRRVDDVAVADEEEGG